MSKGIAAVAMILTAAISAFFVFYTGRLLYITHFLRATRAGGGGAFIGAVAFPLLAIGFAWASWRCFRAGRAT